MRRKISVRGYNGALVLVACALFYGVLVVAAGYCFGQGRDPITVDNTREAVGYFKESTKWNLVTSAYSGAILGTYSNATACSKVLQVYGPRMGKDLHCLPTEY